MKKKLIHIFIVLLIYILYITGCSEDTEKEKPENLDPVDREENMINLYPDEAFVEVPSVKQAEYEWKNARLGGGGYITGLVFNPNTENVLYVRSDVAGPFKWDAGKREWSALFDFLNLSESDFYAVDGIAIDPNNPNVVYAAAGERKRIISDVLKSVDGGATWSKTGLNKQFFGNDGYGGADERVTGECIMVDPANSDIIYCGTREEGLWRSFDGAASWENITDVPAGRTGAGIRCVMFSNDKAAVNSKTKKIYIGVVENGVYMSDDGGETWKHMEGSPKEPKHMEALSDGRILVVSGKTSWNFDKNDKVDEQDGLFLYDGNGGWSDIGPKKKTLTGDVAVYPGDENILVCNEVFEKKMYISKDCGKTWKELVMNPNYDLEWWPAYSFNTNTTTMVFDPFKPNELWFTCGFGIWRCEDIFADTVEWHPECVGIEETVVADIAVPPLESPVVLAGFLDFDGLAFTDLDRAPSKIFGTPGMGDTVAIDYCWNKPEIVFRTGGSWAGKKEGNAGYSTDGGLSWSYLPSKWNFTNGGALALSSDVDNKGNPAILFVPINDVPKVSFDMGATWTDSKGFPAGAVRDFWEYRGNIAEGDKSDPNVFYLYHKYRGEFYKSEDRGLTFTKISTLPGQLQWNYVNVKTWHSVPGLVFVSTVDKGLYYSTDYGTTFNRFKSVGLVRNLAFGKGPDNVAWPSVYLNGRLYNIDGMYRSDDLGKTWLRINDENSRLGFEMAAVEGDTRTHGTVYIGAGGRGLMYGKPKK